MNDNPVVRLEQMLSSLTKTQRKVAEYILQEPVSTSYLTVDKIAHAADVSTATVVRLASNLGYNGFVEFQQSIQQYFLNRPDTINRYALSNEFVSTNEWTSERKRDFDAIQSITQTHIENLNRTFQELSSETICPIVESILNANRVYVSGARTSQAAAQYFSFSLNRMFSNSMFVRPDPSIFIETIGGVSEHDVIIVFCARHYYKYTQQLASFAKSRGATVIGIQDRNNTPLTPFLDYELTAYCRTNIYHNSTLSFVYMADILTGLCSHAAPERVKANEAIRNTCYKNIIDGKLWLE